MDAELAKRMTDGAHVAVRALEDARTDLRDSAKALQTCGTPSEFHHECLRLMMAVESLEARVSEYAVEVTQ